MIRPRGDYYWGDDYIQTSDLYVPEHVGTSTGVLDIDGNEIIRPPRKIGFI